LLLATVTPVQAAAVAPDSSRVRVGITSLFYPWGDDSEVRVWLTVAKASRCVLTRHDYWGTNGGAAPHTVVTRLLVTVGGDTVYVPFRAYADLSEPLTIAIKCDTAVAIVMTGGDAAGSYFARFLVGPGLVLKTGRVESGEFPNDVWEETRYSYFGPSER